MHGNKRIENILLTLIVAFIMIFTGCEKSNTPSPPSRGTRANPNMSLSTSNNVSSITADGQSALTIIARVYRDTDKPAVDGTSVTFSTSKGSFSGASSITVATTNGIAQAVLTSATETGRSFVRANCTSLGVAASYSVEYVAGDLANISITTSASEINADGTSSVALTATAVDAFGNLVEERIRVTFTTTSGSLSAASGNVVSSLREGVKSVAAADVHELTLESETGSVTAMLTSVSSPNNSITATITVTGWVVGSSSTYTDSTTVDFVEYEEAYVLYVQADTTNISILNDTATVTVTLADANNVAIQGAQITVASTLGVLTTPAVTDSNGRTTTTLTSQGYAGQAVVTVAYGNTSTYIVINIAAGEPGGVQSILLEAIPGLLNADGTDDAIIRARVISTDGYPVADGTLVTFAITSGPTDPGTVTPTATTTCISAGYTDCGIAEAVYTAGTDVGIVEITGTAGSLSSTVDVTLVSGTGTNISITAFPASLVANGASTSQIVAIVYDDNGNRVQGVTVTFAATLGSVLPLTAITNSDGVASTVLTSSMTPGTSSVSATALQTVAATTVAFTNTGVNITLTATPSTISANGTSTSTITALLRDGNNNPIPNQNIQFTTNVGTVTSSAATNSNGIATATLTSVRRKATATVTASYGNATPATISVNITGISLTIEANPTTLLNNGVDESKIIVTLKDASGSPIQSESIVLTSALAGVLFEQRNSAGTPIQNTTTTITGTTNINGQFTVYATAPVTVAGDAVITATGAGLTSVDNINVTITFTAYNFFITITDADAAINTCDGSGGVTDASIVTVTLQDNAVPPNGIAGVPVDIFTTLGSIDDNPPSGVCDDTPQSVLGVCPSAGGPPAGGCTDGAGQYSYTLWGGTITGTAQITARAVYDPDGVGPLPALNLVSNSSMTLGAITPANLSLTATPNRVAYSGNTSTISASVTDAIGNPVANKIVSFSITNGPGGGESLTPSTAQTNSNGVATITFTSGSLPSFYNGVTITASVSDGAGGFVTNTVTLTITGPPAHVAVGYDLTLVDDADGTFKEWIAIVVTDVYGNAVADGTTVTLGVREVGFFAQDQITYFASEDANSNGLLDCAVVDPGCGGGGVVNACPGVCEDGSTGYPKNGILDPQSSAVIPSSATTVAGVARVQLVYTQSDACSIRIRIDAESGGVADPDGVLFTLYTTVEKGCPQAKYYSNISPGGATSFSYTITNGSSVLLSLNDYSTTVSYQWTLTGLGTIDTIAGPVCGTGKNTVTYTAPPLATPAGTATVTVWDCSGNSRYININYSDFAP